MQEGHRGFVTGGRHLADAGYPLLPEPRQISFSGGVVPAGGPWRVAETGQARGEPSARQLLAEELADRRGVALDVTEGPGGDATRMRVELSIRTGSVPVGAAGDPDTSQLALEAYQLTITRGRALIQANAGAGLYYGVTTLLQLLRHDPDGLTLPEVDIVDWPDVQFRAIFWDDSEHLEQLSSLRRAIRTASLYKINVFVLKLDGHFQYRHAPALSEPQALSPQELQGLTDYGLARHVQVTPYVDAPAHVEWILKHPEYEQLRAFPDCNYEMSTTNPATYELLEAIYQDLLDANEGADHFFLSTDEAYYLGHSSHASCREAELAEELGSTGKVLAQFLERAAGYLHQRGRKVYFWGEFPVEPDDIPSLPGFLVNGESYGVEHDSVYAEQGFRQLIFTSTQGEEHLFPTYYSLANSRMVEPTPGAPFTGKPSRLLAMHKDITAGPTRQLGNLMGVFIAAWADAGVHPEAFWLGLLAGAAWGWNPSAPSPEEAASRFFSLFYDPNAASAMKRIYTLLSHQAQFHETSWHWGAAASRVGIWGGPYGRYLPRQPAGDQTLPLPALPQLPTLRRDSDWRRDNVRRLRLATAQLAANDELLGLLRASLDEASHQAANLQALISIATLARQDLEFIVTLGRLDEQLQLASDSAVQHDTPSAVAHLDTAVRTVLDARQHRNGVLAQVVEVWNDTWQPKVAEANGRRLVHEVSDVKDHLPARTADMSYLVNRQLLLPMGAWFEDLVTIRNEYARSAGAVPREMPALRWSDTEMVGAPTGGVPA